VQGGGAGWSVDSCVCVLRCCGSVCPATACCLTRATAVDSNVVDLYNSVTGTWSTAQLSVARCTLAAASVGNVALFAGGYIRSSALLCRRGSRSVDDFVHVECLRVLRCCGYVCPLTACCLTRATAGGILSNAVDLYNSATGTWSTAQLSVPRNYLAAASVGSVALFAGGDSSSALLRWKGRGGWSVDGCVRVQSLRVLRWCGYVCRATACCLTRATADVPWKVVDLYNGTTGTWSTAQLSVARWGLAAASVGNVALFAGGYSPSALLRRKLGGDGVSIVACVLSVCACCGVVVLFALRPLAVSRAPLQVMFPMLWTCTTVQQGRGRRLSSAWRAGILQLHRSGVWLCSLGD
jgi:hypothetical protein